jgi:hypothetical protein
VYIVRHLDNVKEDEDDAFLAGFVKLFWPALHNALKSDS